MEINGLVEMPTFTDKRNNMAGKTLFGSRKKVAAPRSKKRTRSNLICYLFNCGLVLPDYDITKGGLRMI